MKPGNILVTTSGVVKLSDFGASLIVSSSISTKAFTRGPVGMLPTTRGEKMDSKRAE